ncbi:MAG: hypothetical protein ABI947_00695 [Chloroflexota bacterium]
MSDSTSFPAVPSSQFDDLPLPERIANLYGFALAYHDLDDGKRYYAVQDWIIGVAQPAEPRTFWTAMKRRFKKSGVDMSTWCTQLAYVAADRKRYKMDHADAEALYRITQRMDTETGLRNEILAYLAKAGVVLDEMVRHPENESEFIAAVQDQRALNKLINEGFTPEEARQWLDQRAQGIETRKWITEVWRKRQAHGKDFAILTNQVSGIVHGKTATQRKLEMGLAKRDTPRNYDAAADQLLTAIVEMSAGALHQWRDSNGFDQLSEDIDDTRPIVDGARPGVYTAFSKKTRRLPGNNKPSLPDSK